MLRARGIDLVLDETFAKFVECHIQEFRLKFSEMSGGGLVARFSASLPIPLEMLSKRGVAVSGPLPRAPISPGKLGNLHFLAKLPTATSEMPCLLAISLVGRSHTNAKSSSLDRSRLAIGGPPSSCQLATFALPQMAVHR